MNIRNVLVGNGRPPTSSVLLVRGVIFSVVVGLILAALVSVSRGALADRISTTAVFKNAGGSLINGADVKYAGVNVGKLYKFRESPQGAAVGGVELDMYIQDRFAGDIPQNVKARVMPASVFGTSFIDLVPPAQAEGHLEEGTRIEQDLSKETLELQTILDGLDRVVKALGPADLASMLGSLAGALDGKGAQLGATIDDLDAFLTKLNPEMPLLRENLSLLAGNLEAFQQSAPDLFAATENALVTARTLAKNSENFTRLVGSGSTFMGKTNTLLTKNEKALSDALIHTAIVVDTLYDVRDPLVRGVIAIGSLSGKLGSIVKNNAMLRIDATVVSPPPSNYDRGDCPRYNGVSGRGC